MGNKKNIQTVTAIVPAFNESERISKVLQILTTYPGFSEVIVVDDGSTDNTEAVAKKYPITFIKTPQNLGKAKAMDLGVKKSQTDIIFFCDADIIGLDHEIIEEIVTPVVNKEIDMSIAMRDRKYFVVNRLISLVPLLGGERALTKELWQKIPSYFKEKFRIETALNFYAKYYGEGMNMKLFPSLKQTIKEKKFGLINGLKRRLKMSTDVAVAIIKLQFLYLPKNISTIRKLLTSMLSCLILILLGLIIIVAVEIGPLKFIFNIFVEELNEDPAAPVVHFLIYIAAQVSRRALLYSAYIIIFSNLLIIILQTNRLIFKLKNSASSLSGVIKKTKSPN